MNAEYFQSDEAQMQQAQAQMPLSAPAQQEEFSDYYANIDLGEVVKRILKYLIEGLAVAVAAYFIPQKKMLLVEILTIAITASATFAVMDIFAPAISTSVRNGAGFGIGAGMVGFPTIPRM